jgi:hypothetical protein
MRIHYNLSPQFEQKAPAPLGVPQLAQNFFVAPPPAPPKSPLLFFAEFELVDFAPLGDVATGLGAMVLSPAVGPTSTRVFLKFTSCRLGVGAFVTCCLWFFVSVRSSAAVCLSRLLACAVKERTLIS